MSRRQLTFGGADHGGGSAHPQAVSNLKPRPMMSPVRAGYSFALLISPLTLTIVDGVEGTLKGALIVALTVCYGLAFMLGAIGAERPHSGKSFSFAVSACASFGGSTSWLAHHYLQEVPWIPWPALLMATTQVLFNLIAGWRFAPPVPAADGTGEAGS